MKSRMPALAIMLFTGACTVTPQNAGVDAAFHPPLTEKHWTSSNYQARNGMHVCAISSGYNGITLTLSHATGNEDVLVQSNRLMQPGAELTVNAGGKTYRAYDTYFNTEMSHALLQSFTQGGQAYLEWSEFSGPVGRERTHVQNIIQLDDFAARLKECRASLQ